MITYTMTRHASVDRLDRLAACVEHLGVGKIILETPSPSDPTIIQQLTATGIILIVSKETGALITGFMAQVSRVSAMYKSQGYTQIPPTIYNRIRKNCSRYSWLLTM